MKMPKISLKNSKYVFFAWVGICLVFAWFSWTQFMNQGLDFMLFYSIGELFSAGQPDGIFITGEQSPFYCYSPLVAPLFRILQWLPIGHSRNLFFGLKIFLVAFWPFILAKLGQEHDRPRNTILAALATILILPTIYEDIIVGNINVFLLTALFSAFALTRMNYVAAGAALFTFVAAFKPQLSLFIVPSLFLSLGQTILGGVLTVGALGLMALNIFGGHALLGHFETWLRLIADPIAGPNDVNNMSLAAAVIRTFTPQQLFMSGDLQNIQLLNLSVESAALIAKVTSVIFILLFIIFDFKSWRVRRLSDCLIDIYASIALITLLVTPVLWQTHYMVLILPLFAVLSLGTRLRSFLAGVATLMTGIALFRAGQLYNNLPADTVVARAYGFLPYSLLLVSSVLLIMKYSLVRKGPQPKAADETRDRTSRSFKDLALIGATAILIWLLPSLFFFGRSLVVDGYKILKDKTVRVDTFLVGKRYIGRGPVEVAMSGSDEDQWTSLTYLIRYDANTHKIYVSAGDFTHDATLDYDGYRWRGFTNIQGRRLPIRVEVF